MPRKLVIEKDGVRADAIFRIVDEEKMGKPAEAATISSSATLHLEPAAYELSGMLGLDNVPLAALGKVCPGEPLAPAAIERRP
jgi:hypothetical protein